MRAVFHRPEVIVGLLGCFFFAFQIWWIQNGRFFGGLDTDEGGAITTSLGFHRALAGGVGDLVRASFGTGSGPLVPLLSIPFTVVFGRSATSPILVQPFLIVVSAVAVSGAVARLATTRAAILAGWCILTMPALITSSRTDQFSNGVGAFMCLAIWALVCSDRGHHTWLMVAFGAACGAMTLTRTMAVSFLPAMALAGLVVVAGKGRRAWRNLALAGGVGMLVAVPWWWAQWDYVSRYLLNSGYGSRASIYGEDAIAGRIFAHSNYLLKDFRVFLGVGVVIAMLAVIQGCRGLMTNPRSWVDAHRELLAVWAAAGLSTAALLSSSNRGFWFATPVDSLLVICVVAAGSLLLRAHTIRRVDTAVATSAGVLVLAGGATGSEADIMLGLAALAVTVGIVVLPSSRRAASIGLLVSVVGLATIAASLPLVGPSSGPAGASSFRGQLAGGLEPYLPTVTEADPRLAAPDIDTRRQAASEWAAAAKELDRRLVKLEETVSVGGSGTVAEVISGTRGLFENNTIGVARELGPRGVRWMEIPNTFETSDDEILEYLAPKTAAGTPRLIISIEGQSSPFPDSRGWRRLVRLAEAENWRIQSSIPLPDGGRVVIYEHPENSTGELTADEPAAG